jgi:oxygen-dependent protoporphyrinogen oxidase
VVRIAVVGGGISGLSAAYRLRELAPEIEVVLFEAGHRVGGVLGTVHEDGYQVEWSADNFITTYPWGLSLCRRLGLEGELTSTHPDNRRTFVVRRGRLFRLPDGFLMMAPTRFWPMALTPLLSPWGKLRAAWEYFLPPRKVSSDESVAAFVRRRFGAEVFDRLVEPLVSGVYAADMEKLSLLATLPRFREMEQQYGSLIRAMRKERARTRAHRRESGARYSMFVTLRGGLSQLVEALEAALPVGSVRLRTPVIALEYQSPAWRVLTTSCIGGELAGQPPNFSAGGEEKLCLPEATGKPDRGEAVRSSESATREGCDTGKHSLGRVDAETFDAVILAVPAGVAARLLEPTDVELATLLGSIRYEGTAILALAYDRRVVRHPLDGMGCVIPAAERSPILAVSFSSQKYLHRAPQGKILLRVFVGGARNPYLAQKSAEEVQEIVLPELVRLFDIRGLPEKRWFFPWPRSMPQYDVGHLERVARIRSCVGRWVGLALAGNAYTGVGIPHCIHSGEEAAESVLGQFGMLPAEATQTFEGLTSQKG